ncbi:GTP-binding protein, putative [Eimeria maxima]|uniref:GTP-binding protein, putative n=1 Tax=Eimeria maxima TaxID=5804 RepID=U6M073_EIMMA|nr:GTP-binding protein, putative [Eimeria maxima]CDJ57602.1 GTP-binding protein, putative [Eimeria maxima]
MGCGISSALTGRGDSQLRLHNASPSTSSSRLSLEAKIVLLGDSGVGKSSIALRFSRGRFPLYHEVTIGAAFLQQTVRLAQGNQLKLHIWDTGGQERFRAMAPLYYRDAAGAVVVYDVTAPSSLEAVKFWTKELRQHLGSCCIVVAANKCDLLVGASDVTEEQQQQPQQQQQQQQEGEEEGPSSAAAPAETAADTEKYKNNLAQVKRGIEEVKSFCASNEFAFIECSAKTGQNVNRLFEDLARDVFMRLKDATPADI